MSTYSIKTLAVAEHLLDRLLNVYGDPEVASIDHFMREYTEQLKHFDPEELSEGCKILLGTFKYRRWPRPSECIDACSKARQRIKSRQEALLIPKGRRAGDAFHVISRGDLAFSHWLAVMDQSGREDDRERAELAGEIATSSRYPNGVLANLIGIGPFRMETPTSSDGLTMVFDGQGFRIR